MRFLLASSAIPATDLFLLCRSFSPPSLALGKDFEGRIRRRRRAASLGDRRAGGNGVPGDDHQVHGMRQDGVLGRQAHRRQPRLPQGLLQVTVNGTAYHRSCFKCCHGGCVISPSNYIAHEGKLYCKHHHIQLFKEKGNYSQLENDEAAADSESSAA
ncbi:hypothetical protein GW17_00047636 [Ensete ventricosum]|uniref:Uncharacterized protein n=1 Tax=Ensete ventricosum TaxID=4639 RepID=A0A444CWB0_ENSVE|nr:hypothetical protein B296_00016700 [Ensete ventricosum]RWV90181.1 hypothetical protein GW17_00047636 [Ensete ventricosum]